MKINFLSILFNFFHFLSKVSFEGETRPYYIILFIDTVSMSILAYKVNKRYKTKIYKLLSYTSWTKLAERVPNTENFIKFK